MKEASGYMEGPSDLHGVCKLMVVVQKDTGLGACCGGLSLVLLTSI